MPTPVHTYIERKAVVQYTGSNSAEIDALISNFNITSESGGVLNFVSGSGTFTANTGDWLCYIQGAVNEVWDTGLMNFFYNKYWSADESIALSGTVSTMQASLTALQATQTTTAANLATLTAQFNTLAPSVMLSVGISPVPTLLGSTNATVAVPLWPAMPSSSYTPHAQLFSNGIAIGALTILSTTATSTTNVNVVVRNTGLLSLTGAFVLVAAKS